MRYLTASELADLCALHGLSPPAGGVRLRSRSQCAPYLPTPEEIAEECARIRAEWSEAERLKRATRLFEYYDHGDSDERERDGAAEQRTHYEDR